MRLAILADTHMPKGDRALPAACVERLRAADLILHAGDLMTLEVLWEIEAYGPVAAIRGNVDDWDARRKLPERRVVEAGGARIGMIHDSGPASGRFGRLRNAFPDVDAVVFGHSHIPLHETDAEAGFQIFNPGSPTERRRSPRHTMGEAVVTEGRVEFSLIDLD
jgi:putative phosphoesterase